MKNPSFSKNSKLFIVVIPHTTIVMQNFPLSIFFFKIFDIKFAFFRQYRLSSKYSSLYKSPSFLSKRSCCSDVKDTFNVSGLRNVKLPISRLRVRLIIWANVMKLSTSPMEYIHSSLSLLFVTI